MNIKFIVLFFAVTTTVFSRASDYTLYSISSPMIMDGKLDDWSEGFLLDTLRPDRNTASHYSKNFRDTIVHGDIHAKLYGAHHKDTLFLAVKITKDDCLDTNQDRIVFGVQPLFSSYYSISLKGRAGFPYNPTRDFYQVGKNFFLGVTKDFETGSAVYEWAFVKHVSVMLDSSTRWCVTIEDGEYDSSGEISASVIAFGSDYGFIRCPLSWSAPCFPPDYTLKPSWKLSDSILPIKAEISTPKSLSNDLTCMPNPFNHKLVVRGSVDEGVAFVSIVDLNGHSVYKSKVHMGEFLNINTTKFPAGLYVIQWNSGLKKLFQKCLLVR